MPRDNFCRSITAQLPSPRGQFRKRNKNPLFCGRGNLAGSLGDTLGEGNCESTIAARQWGANFCREALRCRAGPSGKGVTPICSDFPVFFRFVQILVFGNPICSDLSDLLRFLPICSDLFHNKSGNTFLPTVDPFGEPLNLTEETNNY